MVHVVYDTFRTKKPSIASVNGFFYGLTTSASLKLEDGIEPYMCSIEHPQ